MKETLALVGRHKREEQFREKEATDKAQAERKAREDEERIKQL